MDQADNSLEEGYTGSVYDSSLEATGPAASAPPPPRRGPGLFRFNRQALIVTGVVVLIAILFGVVGMMVAGRHSAKQSATAVADNYAVRALRVGQVTPTGQLELGAANHLTVNGELRVSRSLVLAPGSQPTAPVPGQIYYDQAARAPYYFNGQAFVSLGAGQSVTSLGGAAGVIALGNGLQVNGNQLSVSGDLLQQVTNLSVATPKVNSLQGLTGDVTLTAGPGIGISGTTISNTGVVSLTAATPGNLQITHDGQGNYTILDTTGMQQVTLGPSVAQLDTTGFSSIHLDKTGAGNFLELAAAGVNRFVVDQTGHIVSGTIHYSQVQGAPPTTVTEIGGVSGAIGLGAGLDISGNTLSNTGVLDLTGTANQVIISGSTGSITLSLPQAIGVTSMPTFGGAILNGALSVTAGGADLAGGLTVTSGGAAITGGLTVVSGGATINGLGVGLVQSDGSGNLSSGAVDRNSSSYFSNILSVENGGTGVGSFTTNGLLLGNGTGALQVTAAANDSILATDGSGLPSLVQTLPAGVQGNITSTGALSSGSIASGFGTISTTNTIATTSTLQGSGLRLTNTGNSFIATLESGIIAQNTTYVLPDPGPGGDTVCLQTLANCGSANAVTGNGTLNTIARFTGANTIADSSITDDGTTVTINAALLANSIQTSTLQSAGPLTITPGGTLTIGATNQVLTLQGNGGTTLRASASGNVTTLGFVLPTANRSINLPDESGTICLQGSLNCGFATAGSGVTSITGTTGGSVAAVSAITLNNALTTATAITIDDASLTQKGIAQFNATNFTASAGIINTIQPIHTAAAVTFGSLSLGASGDLTLSPGRTVFADNLTTTGGGTGSLTVTAADNIMFSNQGGANTFLFPTTGGTGQVICTSGITCAAGGGQAVILEPGGGVQTANSNNTAVFINKAMGAGNLIQLQTGGTDAFVINASGDTTIANTATANNLIVNTTLTSNTLIPTAALTIGATTQSFTLQGNGTSLIRQTDTPTGFTTTVGFNIGSGGTAPTGNITYRFQNDSSVTPGTYNVCTTAGNCAGVGGGITGAGTAGRLAKFSAPGNITDSLLSESTNLITIDGNLNVGTASNATLTLGVASGLGGSLVFANGSNAFTTTINQSTAPAANTTINLPNASGTFAVSAAGPLNLDVTTGELSCPSCLTGGGGPGGGVSSLQGTTGGSSPINGALTLNNALTTGTTITLDNASTTQKGIAQFNTTNFTASSGLINTIQDIATTSSPTFNNLTVQGPTGLTVGSTTNLGQLIFKDGTVSGFTSTFTPATLGANRALTIPNASGTLAVSASGNLSLSALGDVTITNSPTFTGSVTTPLLQSAGAMNITPGGTLTIGATGQTLMLQGSNATTLRAVSGANSTTLAFAALSGTHTLTIPAETGTICTTGSICTGYASGSGAAFIQGGNSFGATAVLGTNDNNSLQLRTNGATAMTILANGNVGIGTTSPQTPLQVNGVIRSTRVAAPNQYIELDGGDAAAMYLTAMPPSGQAKSFFINNAGTTSGAGRNIQLAIAGVPHLTVADNGNVGIGTTSPSSLLTVGTNTTAAAGGIAFGTDTSLYRSGAGALKTDSSFAAQGTMYINGPGGSATGTLPFATLVQDASSLTIKAYDTSNNNYIKIRDNAIAGSGLTLQGERGVRATTNAFTENAATSRYGFAVQPGVATFGGSSTGNYDSLLVDVPTGSFGGTGTYNLLNLKYGGTSRLAVNINGNVGIGTTNPQAKLHVEGQCVTGDTRLRRRRRRKDGSLSDEWEEVRIDQIAPGDHIMSLDQTTGRFVSRQVKGLMDMGVQQTFLMVTSSGKTIRTTANHPYLVRESEITEIIGGVYEVDQSPKMEQLAKDSYVAIANQHVQFVIKVPKQLKKEMHELYRAKRRLNMFGPAMLAHAVAALAQAANLKANRLTIDREYTGYERRIQELLKFLLPDTQVEFWSIGKHSPAHFAAYGAFTGVREELITAVKENVWPNKKEDRSALDGVGQGALAHLDAAKRLGDTCDLTLPTYQTLADVSSCCCCAWRSGAWRKVHQIKPGMEVATADGWEKIVAINAYARERTYDIEVQGTHTFVGNGIVAHNTYLNGNVGVGTVGPAYALDVQGGTGIVGQFSGRVIGGDAVNTNEFATLGQVNTIASGTNFIQNGTALQTNANFNIQSAAAGSVGGIIRGAAGGQTADLLQLQNSSGGVLSKVDSVGNLYAPTFGALYFGNTNYYVSAASSDNSLRLRAPSNIALLINGVEKLRLDSSGNLGIGTATAGAKLQVNADASGIGQIIRANATTPGDLLQLQNNAGTVLSHFDANGRLGVATSAAPGALLEIGTNTSLPAIGLRVLGFTATSANPNFEIGDGNSVYWKLYRDNSNTFQILQSNTTTWTNTFAGNTLLALKGASGQTADLLQLQNSGGTVLASVNSAGQYRTTVNNSAPTGIAISQSGSFISGTAALEVQPGAVGRQGILVRATSGQTGDLLIFQDATPTTLLNVTAGGNLNLAATSATGGQITQAGLRFIHSNGDATNFFAGRNAGNLSASLTATNSTGVGNNALLALTSGGFNAAFGVSALQSTTSGNVNTGVGPYALFGNTTGLNNTGLGYQAGVTSVSANANTTGSNNTFIGYNAGPGSATQLQNATAIGTYATVSQNDSLVLGCINGINGCTANIKVGIGTAAPAYVLDVVGGSGIVAQFSGRVIGADAINSNEFATKAQLDAVTGGSGPTGAFAQGGNSFGSTAILGTNDANDLQFETGGTTKMTIQNSTGNVGIGTTSPGAKLQINTGAAGVVGQIIRGAATQTANLQEWQSSTGSILSYVSHAGDLYIANNISSGTNLYLGPTGGVQSRLSNSLGYLLVSGSSANTNNGIIVQQKAGQTADLFQLQNSTGSVLSHFDASGNLAIARAAAPAAALDVTGGVIARGLNAPVQPTVTNQGTAGSTAYTYCVTALSGTGETACSPVQTTTTGNATLDGSNFNRITWTAVTGATGYKVYRTASSGTPTTVGQIAAGLSASTLTFDDTGIAVSTANQAPSGNTSGTIQAQNGVTYDANSRAYTRIFTRTAPTAVGDYVEVFRIDGDANSGKQLRIQLTSGGGASATSVSKEYIAGTNYNHNGHGRILTSLSTSKQAGYTGTFDVELEMVRDGANAGTVFRIRTSQNTLSITNRPVTVRVDGLDAATTPNLAERTGTGTSAISSNNYSSVNQAATGGSISFGIDASQAPLGASLVAGSNGKQANAFLVQNTSGTSFLTADGANTKLTVSGSAANVGNIVVTTIAPPAGTPTVTNQGTAGTTAYTYVITSRTKDGNESVVSTAATTPTGNATLNSTNFNRITWNHVSGAYDYRIYRTASAGTPSSTGLIGTVLDSAQAFNATGGVVANTFDDTGIAGTTAAPVAQSGNLLKVGVATTADLLAQFLIGTDNAARKGLVVQGVASQTADLFQLQDSAGTVLSKFDSTGNLAVTSNGSNTGTVLIGGSLQLAAAGAGNTITNLNGSGGNILINTGAGATSLAINTTGTSGTRGLSIYSGGASSAVQIQAGAVGPANQAAILFGSAQDTNLYRSAADTLRTDDSLVVGTQTFTNDINFSNNSSPVGAGIKRITRTLPANVGDYIELFDVSERGTDLDISITAGGTGHTEWGKRYLYQSGFGTNRDAIILPLSSQRSVGAVTNDFELESVNVSGGTNRFRVKRTVASGGAAVTLRITVTYNTAGIPDFTPTATGTSAITGRTTSMNTLSGTTTLLAGTAASTALTIQGAASQTADLLQLQNSAGTVLSKFDASGILTLNNLGATGTGVLCANASNQISTCGVGAGSGSYIYNSTGLQSSANFNIQSAFTNGVGGIIRGAVGQTADLFQLQDSAGTVLSSFDANGNLTVGSTTNVRTISSPGAGANSEHFGASSTTNNATNALAVGNLAVVATGGNSATAIGYNAQASSSSATALGADANAAGVAALALGRSSTTTGFGSVAVGYQANASNSAGGVIALGQAAAATNTNTIAIGLNAASSGARTITLGAAAVASGTDGLAVGYNTSVTGNNSLAIGNNAIANFAGNGLQVAIGHSANITGQQSVGIGANTVLSGAQTVLLGTSASSTSANSVVIGYSASATGTRNVVLGSGASASFGGNQQSVVIGRSAASTAQNAIAIGDLATANNTHSIALGSAAATTANNQLVIGSTTSAITSAFIGNGVTHATPLGFTLQGTGSTTDGTAGANVTVQGGTGTVGNTNGGNLLLNGGTKAGTGTVGHVILQGSNGGNVGIGTASPSNTLSVNGSLDLGANGNLHMGNGRALSWSSGGTTFNASNSIIGSAGNALAITATGGLSITGATTTNGNLTVAGTISSPGAGANSEHFGAGSTAAGGSSLAVGNTAVAGGSNAVALGASSTANGSNSIAIGNLANTGSNVNSIALGRSAATNADNQLVIGSASAAISSAFIGNGVTTAAPVGFTLQGTGGSGTNIAGASVALAGGRGTGNAAGGNLNFQVALPGSSGSGLNALSTVFSLSGTNGAALFKNAADSTTAFQIQNAAGTSNLFVADTTSNRIGIGTAAPLAQLHLVATSAAASGTDYGLLSQQTKAAAFSGDQYGGYLQVLSSSSSAITGNLVGALGEVTKTGTGAIANAYGLQGAVNNTNATGVITNAYALYLGTPTRTGTVTNDFGVYQEYASAKNYFAGSVGIGTNNPLSNNAFNRLLVAGNDSNPVVSSVLNSGSGQASFLLERTGGTASAWSTYLPTGSTNLTWFNGVVGANRMSLTAAGVLTTTGIHQTGTPDISEYIPAADDVEAADVVVADPNNTERVIKSTVPYQSSAVGVISDGTSGFINNKYQDANGVNSRSDIKPIVIAGRVPVKVTDEGGEIRPGDYLTPSSTPGHAMKATGPGPTVGKSLGFFDGTTGTVLAFIQNSYYDPASGSQIQGGGDINIANLAVSGSLTAASLNISGMSTLAGLTVTGSTATQRLLVVEDATFQGNITVAGHLITAGSAPAGQVLGALGLGAAVSIDGNDTAGTLTITTGSTAVTAGDLVRLTFAKPFGKAPRVILSGQDGPSLDAKLFPSAKSAADFMLKTEQTLPPHITYTFDYFIVE